MARRFYLADGKTRCARINFRTTPEIKAQAILAAKKNNVSLAEMIETALLKHMAKA